jgi:16S rRNA processing protein RimM
MLLEIGRITKSHGVLGDVLVALVTDRRERLDPGSVLETDRGPLTVIRSSKHNDRWIVAFDAIAGRDAADTWRGVVLRAEAIDDPDTLFVHQLVGARVLDAEGVDRGVVESVQANPASDLLVMESGALIPLRFIVDGPIDGVIRIDAPDGLFDL